MTSASALFTGRRAARPVSPTRIRSPTRPRIRMASPPAAVGTATARAASLMLPGTRSRCSSTATPCGSPLPAVAFPDHHGDPPDDVGGGSRGTGVDEVIGGHRARRCGVQAGHHW